MRPYDYITAEDWNALGLGRQLELRDGLKFTGYRVSKKWFPPEYLKNGDFVVGLYEDGDLAVARIHSVSNRISLEEVLTFIELTSFRVS